MCAPEILWLLRRPKSHMYICGLKGLEDGVDDALIDITRTHGINWLAFKSEMHVAGRYHIEVYCPYSHLIQLAIGHAYDVPQGWVNPER